MDKKWLVAGAAAAVGAGALIYKASKDKEAPLAAEPATTDAGDAAAAEHRLDIAKAQLQVAAVENVTKKDEAERLAGIAPDPSTMSPKMTAAVSALTAGAGSPSGQVKITGAVAKVETTKTDVLNQLASKYNVGDVSPSAAAKIPTLGNIPQKAPAPAVRPAVPVSSAVNAAKAQASQVKARVQVATQSASSIVKTAAAKTSKEMELADLMAKLPYFAELGSISATLRDKGIFSVSKSYVVGPITVYPDPVDTINKARQLNLATIKGNIGAVEALGARNGWQVRTYLPSEAYEFMPSLQGEVQNLQKATGKGPSTPLASPLSLVKMTANVAVARAQVQTAVAQVQAKQPTQVTIPAATLAFVKSLKTSYPNGSTKLSEVDPTNLSVQTMKDRAAAFSKQNGGRQVIMVAQEGVSLSASGGVSRYYTVGFYLAPPVTVATVAKKAAVTVSKAAAPVVAKAQQLTSALKVAAAKAPAAAKAQVASLASRLSSAIKSVAAKR